MGKDESTQVSRRTTRLSACTSPNPKAQQEDSKATNRLQSSTVNDLVFHGESSSIDELIDSFPGRKSQILELVHLLGPLNSPMIPLFVHGGASTGKTSVILQMFRHLRRPFIYCSCVTCYNPRILFESILNQLLLRRKNESTGYVSAKRCEKPSDFVNLLREVLSNLIDNLKGNGRKSSSKKLGSQVNGSMVYLVFDNLELVREWDKCDTIIPLLFNLYDILKMPEVGVIFVSRASLDTFQSNTGYVEPYPVYFSDYTEKDLHQIFMRNQSKPELYSYFLDLVLGTFYRITRRVDELSTAFAPLFKKYCELLGDVETVTNEMRRNVYYHLKSFITLSLNETFAISSRPFLNATANKDRNMGRSIGKKPGVCVTLDEIDFHMPTSAKYLLISAFLASRNPATLDASLFDSTGGSDNRKRKRKVSERSMDNKESKEQDLRMKGPGSFPLERLLAIFQCIASVAEYSLDGDEPQNDDLGNDGSASGLMTDILLQLSSLCGANFITKGGSCPLEGSTRYRSTVSEDLALKVARSLNFPLSKYMYRM
ncbi:hypothetical protein ACS0TY_019394 [Phlomoides rotata]